MSYILAIDQGTQSTRASILNRAGQVEAQSSLPVAVTRPANNRVEQDAEILAISVEMVIEQVLDQVPYKIRSSVDCCGIATQRSTVVSWDTAGKPVSAALNWQDTRGQDQLVQLQKYAAEIKHCSGLPLSAHYGATKLRWLIENCGNNQGIKFGPISSFLLYRISDVQTSLVDHANAQRMQLLDISTRQWSDSLSQLFGVPIELLPQCCPVCHDFGVLKGLDIPINAMNGDQNAAWFGSGLPEAGTTLVNLGSGGFILTQQAAGTGLPDLLSTIACSDRAETSYLMEATVNGCGNALQWLVEHYQIDDYQVKISPALEQISEPPIFLNTVGGLGSPWWISGLAPRFLDHSGELSESRMIAGVCESILFLIFYNILQIQRVKAISELQLSGGLSKLDLMCQKLADLSGVQVKRMNQSESTTKGIAWIARGKPENWAISEYDRFQPEADVGLRSRFEQFVDQLSRYIEGASSG